jgi:hypothetical protein
MSVLSELENRDHIRFWQNTTGHRIFIETGTYLGETTLAMADVFYHCYTIGYDRSVYDRTNVIFSDRKNITLYHGDSGKLLGSILANLNEPAIFWLDAHYSGGITGRAETDTPIRHELRQILQHSVKNHVFLEADRK